MKDNFKLLEINIDCVLMKEVLEKSEKYLNQTTINRQQITKKPQRPLVIFTPNPEIVMYAQNHEWFKEVVNSGQINIPDGTGIISAARVLGYPIRERVAGADLAFQLAGLAEKESVTIGLIGGFANLALKAFECLKADYPKLNGWAQAGPELKIKNEKLKIVELDFGNWDVDQFITYVRERKTRILLVGLGCPKQELFINEIAPKLDNIILLAVGGTFNYFSGKITRAPKIMQSLGLEWLDRLYKEPWRIKRQIVLLKFIVRVILSRFGITG